MSGPRLSRKLVLEEAQRVPDGAGGFALTWVTKGTLWAAVEAGAGRGRAGAGPCGRSAFLQHSKDRGRPLPQRNGRPAPEKALYRMKRERSSSCDRACRRAST